MPLRVLLLAGWNQKGLLCLNGVGDSILTLAECRPANSPWLPSLVWNFDLGCHSQISGVSDHALHTGVLSQAHTQLESLAWRGGKGT